MGATFRKLLVVAAICVSAFLGSNAKAQSQQVQIFWNDSIGTISREHWGLNDSQAMYPPHNNTYFNVFDHIQPTFIRIYHPSLMDAWTDSSTRTWNVSKIRQGLDGLVNYGYVKVMFNIPIWPKWLAPTNAPLPDSSKPEFTRLCKELARIMKREVYFKVDYYEILNEPDSLYRGHITDACLLVDSVITNMKRADTTAKYGGISFGKANKPLLDTLLNTCGSQLDFVSYHNYPSGRNGVRLTNDELLNDRNDSSHSIMASVKIRFPQMKVFCTEFNVSTKQSGADLRMKNSIGAIWLIQSIKKAAVNNIDALMVYTLRDSTHGLFGRDFVRSPQAAIHYDWGNGLLSGRLCRSTSTDSSKLEVIALKRQGDEGALIILNKQDSTAHFNNFERIIYQPSNMYGLGQLSGTDLVSTNPEGYDNLTLPPYSITLISYGFEFSVNEKLNGTSFLVHPNPASTHFQIMGKTEYEGSLKLINPMGQTITQYIQANNNYELPSGIAAGLYYILLDETEQRIKLIIK